MSFTLKRENEVYILRYFWGDNALARQQSSVSTGSISRSNSIWALDITPWKETTKAREEVKSMIRSLRINIEKSKWHPAADRKFFSRAIPLFDISNSWINHVRLLVIPIWLAELVSTPIAYIFAFIIAYSPPATVSFTVFIPLILMTLIAYLIYKYLRRKRESK